MLAVANTYLLMHTCTKLRLTAYRTVHMNTYVRFGHCFRNTGIDSAYGHMCFPNVPSPSGNVFLIWNTTLQYYFDICLGNVFVK